MGRIGRCGGGRALGGLRHECDEVPLCTEGLLSTRLRPAASAPGRVGRVVSAEVGGTAGQGRAGQGRAGQGRAGQGRAGQGRAQLCRYGLTQPERRYHAEVVRVVAHVHDQIDPLLGAVGREVSHRVVPRVSHVAVHADPRRPALHRVTRQHSRIVGATAKPTSAISRAFGEGDRGGDYEGDLAGHSELERRAPAAVGTSALHLRSQRSTRSSTERVEYWSSTH